MNRHADILTTKAAQTTGLNRPSSHLSHLMPLRLPLQLTAITRNLARRLCQAASSPAPQKRIMKKSGWNDWIFHSIDWDAKAKALSALERAQELFVTKWARNLLLT